MPPDKKTNMVAGDGIEPPLSANDTDMLPLHYPAI